MDDNTKDVLESLILVIAFVLVCAVIGKCTSDSIKSKYSFQSDEKGHTIERTKQISE
jgi:hypothetical protein